MLDVMRHLLPQLLNTFSVFGKRNKFLKFAFNLLVFFSILEFVKLSLINELFLKNLRIH